MCLYIPLAVFLVTFLQIWVRTTLSTSLHLLVSLSLRGAVGRTFLVMHRTDKASTASYKIAPYEWNVGLVTGTVASAVAVPFCVAHLSNDNIHHKVFHSIPKFYSDRIGEQNFCCLFWCLSRIPRVRIRSFPVDCIGRASSRRGEYLILVASLFS